MQYNTPNVNDFDEPPEEWDEETVTFNSHNTWEVFGKIIIYKHKSVHDLMSDPETPEEIYELNEPNLKALEKMLKQFKVLDENNDSMPIIFQFNEPLELTQALFACRFAKQGIKQETDENLPDNIDEQIEEIDRTMGKLSDVHWDESITEIMAQLDYFE